MQQINSGTANTLYHLRFIDNNNCIIGGGDIWNYTTVIQSADGGYTFHPSSCPSVHIGMQGLSVSSFGSVYMCGTNGKVVTTPDTGKTWKLGVISDAGYYIGISFFSHDTGILVSTHLQQDGMITQIDSDFNIISQQHFNFGLNDIYVTGATTAYVIGYGSVVKTTDGHTWNYLNVKGDNFMGMDVHGNEIWMCGYNGSIYHSSDAGNSWKTLRNGNDITIPRYNLMSIVFKDAQNGWAASDNGKVIHTDDAGDHWEEYDQFTTNSLRSIALCPNGDLLVCGDNGALFRIVPKQ